jgi:DNA-binding CsgD family transcriptional regulator
MDPRPQDEEGARVATFTIGDQAFMVLSVPKPELESPLLTRTENEVLRLACAGRSNREIALVRGRSTRTIANQLSAIYVKLGLRSRSELCARFGVVRTAP